jgi:hypothetical protein
MNLIVVDSENVLPLLRKCFAAFPGGSEPFEQQIPKMFCRAIAISSVTLAARLYGSP